MAYGKRSFIMKNKILAVLSILYIYIYGIAPANAWALHDATSFSPEQVQVQAANIGVPVGTVLVWTKEAIPEGWLECDGQKINSNLYPELAELMPSTPNYKGRFLQGIDTNTKVGDKFEAGLPNITGHWSNGRGNWQARGYSGAIYQGGSVHTSQAGRYWGSDYTWDFLFNASRVNSVYGKSNTVQPPAVVVKYIIKAE